MEQVSKQYTKGEEEIGEYFMQAKAKVLDPIGDDGPVFDSYVDQHPDKPKYAPNVSRVGVQQLLASVLTGDNRFFVYRNNAMQGFGDSDFVLYMHDNVDSDVYMAFSKSSRSVLLLWQHVRWKQRTQYQSLFNTANAKGFWKSYYETEIREKYSIDNRILDCEMYLTGSDLATSTWGDIIRIDLQYYYLESVRDYVEARRLQRCGCVDCFQAIQAVPLLVPIAIGTS